MGSSKKGVRRDRRVFSAEFKAEAVRMLAERRAAGASVAQIGRELAVRPDLLRVWAKERPAAVQSGGAVPGETLEQENRRLRRELATLQQEQAFLKKAAADSTSQSNSLCKHNRRCAKAERLSWASIELHGNLIQIALGVDR
jgi:transposase